MALAIFLGGCAAPPPQQVPVPAPPPPAALAVKAPTPVIVPAPPASTVRMYIPAVIAPKLSPETNGKPVSFWSEDIPGSRAEVVFVRNNTDKRVYYRNLELYNCFGVEQPCGVDKQKVVLDPHGIQRAMIVKVADPGGFHYSVRLIYGYVQPGRP